MVRVASSKSFGCIHGRQSSLFAPILRHPYRRLLKSPVFNCSKAVPRADFQPSPVIRPLRCFVIQRLTRSKGKTSAPFLVQWRRLLTPCYFSQTFGICHYERLPFPI